jgi:hypothetical protein
LRQEEAACREEVDPSSSQDPDQQEEHQEPSYPASVEELPDMQEQTLIIYPHHLN